MRLRQLARWTFIFEEKDNWLSQARQISLTNLTFNQHIHSLQYYNILKDLLRIIHQLLSHDSNNGSWIFLRRKEHWVRVLFQILHGSEKNVSGNNNSQAFYIYTFFGISMFQVWLVCEAKKSQHQLFPKAIPLSWPRQKKSKQSIFHQHFPTMPTGCSCNPETEAIFFSFFLLPKLNNPVSCRFITINWTIGYIGNNPWGSVTLNNTSLLCLWQKNGKV